MPIYRLTRDLSFPPPQHAEDGLLAIGGDLSPQRLLLAYSSGIFPWYNRGEPVLWWSPDPRAIFEPATYHIPRRLLRTIKSGKFTVTCDTAFSDVIHHCARTPRPGQRGTWITREMIAAYNQLHALGYAHSFETWHEGQLVGGLYGVSLGAAFFGESMFAHATDASKAAFAVAMRGFSAWDFDFVDGQVMNDHLFNLGALQILRDDFLARLQHALTSETRRGNWQNLFPLAQ